MHAVESYVKNAERCERLARESRGRESRAHFLDAAAYWRRMAVERQVTRQQEADAPERGQSTTSPRPQVTQTQMQVQQQGTDTTKKGDDSNEPRRG